MSAKYATSAVAPVGPDLLSSRAGREETAMDTGYTLDQFLADTRAAIKTKGVPSGLAEIRDRLENLLRNPELLKKHLGEPVPYKERTTIGHDPETDVHVLVHGREKGGKSVPHDHGPCWVIRQLQESDADAPVAPPGRREQARPRGARAPARLHERGRPRRGVRGRRHPFDRVRRRHVLHPGHRRRRREPEDAALRPRQEERPGRRPGPGPAVVGPRRAARRQRSRER